MTVWSKMKLLYCSVDVLPKDIGMIFLAIYWNFL